MRHFKRLTRELGGESFTSSAQIAVERIEWTVMEDVNIESALAQIEGYAMGKNIFYFGWTGGEYPIDFLIRHRGYWYIFARELDVKILTSEEERILGKNHYSCYGVAQTDISILRSKKLYAYSGGSICMLISNAIQSPEQLMKYFIIENRDKADIQIDYKHMIESECVGDAIVALLPNETDGVYWFDLYQHKSMLTQPDIIHFTDDMINT